MLDHLEIRTPEVEKTVAFYATVLAPLGYTLKVDSKAKGFGDESRLDMFIVEGEPSTNVHFAFEASTRDVVNEIYKLAQDKNFVTDRKPALASTIHPNYYAGYLRDPDGRLVEFVCHAKQD